MRIKVCASSAILTGLEPFLAQVYDCFVRPSCRTRAYLCDPEL